MNAKSRKNWCLGGRWRRFFSPQSWRDRHSVICIINEDAVSLDVQKLLQTRAQSVRSDARSDVLCAYETAQRSVGGALLRRPAAQGFCCGHRRGWDGQDPASPLLAAAAKREQGSCVRVPV